MQKGLAHGLRESTSNCVLVTIYTRLALRQFCSQPLSFLSRTKSRAGGPCYVGTFATSGRVGREAINYHQCEIERQVAQQNSTHFVALSRQRRRQLVLPQFNL